MKFYSEQQISVFFSKIFGDKMSQAWSRQLENGGLGHCIGGFLFFHQSALSSLF